MLRDRGQWKVAKCNWNVWSLLVVIWTGTFVRIICALRFWRYLTLCQSRFLYLLCCYIQYLLLSYVFQDLAFLYNLLFYYLGLSFTLVLKNVVDNWYSDAEESDMQRVKCRRLQQPGCVAGPPKLVPAESNQQSPSTSRNYGTLCPYPF